MCLFQGPKTKHTPGVAHDRINIRGNTHPAPSVLPQALPRGEVYSVRAGEREGRAYVGEERVISCLIHSGIKTLVHIAIGEGVEQPVGDEACIVKVELVGKDAIVVRLTAPVPRTPTLHPGIGDDVEGTRLGVP